MQVSNEIESQVQLFQIWFKVIIRDDRGRVLLVKDRHNNCWEIPGDGWHKNIDLIEAIHTAIKEETGVDIKEPKLHQITSRMYGSPLVFMFCSANYAGSELTLGADISDIKWVEEKDVEDILEFSSHLRAYQDSLIESTSGTRHRIMKERGGVIATDDFDTL